MDTNKLKSLKNFNKALKASNFDDEFTEHVNWLCSVVEGSYCIPSKIEDSWWVLVNIMLDDTLETLEKKYEFSYAAVEILKEKEYEY